MRQTRAFGLELTGPACVTVDNHIEGAIMDIHFCALLSASMDIHF